MDNFSINKLEHFNDQALDAYFNSIERDEYLNFSLFWQTCFITSDWIVPTGNFQTVNMEFIDRFLSNIKKHSFIFRIFRMIFGV